MRRAKVPQHEHEERKLLPNMYSRNVCLAFSKFYIQLVGINEKIAMKMSGVLANAVI